MKIVNIISNFKILIYWIIFLFIYSVILYCLIFSYFLKVLFATLKSIIKSIIEILY